MTSPSDEELHKIAEGPATALSNLTGLPIIPALHGEEVMRQLGTDINRALYEAGRAAGRAERRAELEAIRGERMDGVSDELKRLIESAGGSIDDAGVLPDSSGFMTASFPLPEAHWLYAEGFNVPPMPLRMGTDDPRREAMRARVIEAARYAVRASTMNGERPDFDPDAMVLNFVVAMLGYHTPDGLSSDDWANPPGAKE